MIYKILLFLSKFIKYETAEDYEALIGLKYLKSKAREHWFENEKEGKYWLACSPEFKTENSLITDHTKYKVHYWVNYGDSDTYGWFTVEQIIKWLTEPETKLHTLGGRKELKSLLVSK